MSNYSGAKCFSCGEVFKDGDDIVVCPDCGTPYHRACYQKEGKCINTELHENEGSWSARDPKGENIRCSRCGFENTPDRQVCRQCGLPLSEEGQSYDARRMSAFGQPELDPEKSGEEKFDPFGGSDPSDRFSQSGQPGAIPGTTVFNQDSEVDGVKLGDYARYVRVNPMGFLPSFLRFAKIGGKISVNFFAFLMPEVYFFYRKMNKWGALFCVIVGLLSVPGMMHTFAEGGFGIKLTFSINVLSDNFEQVIDGAGYALLGVRLLAGMFANYIYYKKARTDILKIRSDESLDDTAVKTKIMEKGGVSWGMLVLGILISTIITMTGMVGINLAFASPV